MGKIRGATKRAQIPLLRIVINIPVKLPTDTPSNNPVATYAVRVSAQAIDTRKIFVTGFPRTLSLPEPKNATA
jgi:hypothetical protein